MSEPEAKLVTRGKHYGDPYRGEEFFIDDDDVPIYEDDGSAPIGGDGT
jgi:hypothetical protein